MLSLVRVLGPRGRGWRTWHRSKERNTEGLSTQEKARKDNESTKTTPKFPVCVVKWRVNGVLKAETRWYKLEQKVLFSIDIKV